MATRAIDYVLDGDRELRDVERALRRAPTHDPDARRRRCSPSCIIASRRSDGYSARARAATLLAGLGFAEARHGDPVASFSGGWRMRLNLAQALMCRSDLLLLDEPTNHLDLDAVLWLEDWLGKYPGTLLLITHDRDFLDGVVDGIVHVDARKLVSYTGNYAQFERERAVQLALQQATYAKQQRQVAHSALVHRPLSRQGHQGEAGAKPDQGARAHGAHRRGARRQPVRVRVRARAATARQLVLLEHATLGYDERAAGARGRRLGASFPATASASSVPTARASRRCSRRSPARWPRSRASGASRRGCASAISRSIRSSSCAKSIRRCGICGSSSPTRASRSMRDFLGGFDFRGDMATAAVGNFSGGEKARLTLALIVRQRPICFCSTSRPITSTSRCARR